MCTNILKVFAFISSWYSALLNLSMTNKIQNTESPTNSRKTSITALGWSNYYTPTFPSWLVVTRAVNE